MRLVDVIDASAMTAFMFSFSASRSKGLRLPDLFLSFFLILIRIPLQFALEVAW